MVPAEPAREHPLVGHDQRCRVRRAAHPRRRRLRKRKHRDGVHTEHRDIDEHQDLRAHDWQRDARHRLRRTVRLPGIFRDQDRHQPVQHNQHRQQLHVRADLRQLPPVLPGSCRHDRVHVHGAQCLGRHIRQRDRAVPRQYKWQLLPRVRRQRIRHHPGRAIHQVRRHISTIPES